MNFTPNLFGKFCFVVFICFVFWVVNGIMHKIKTGYLLIDFPLLISLYVLGAWLATEFIWKFFKLWK